jgi:hypothetical protein
MPVSTRFIDSIAAGQTPAGVVSACRLIYDQQREDYA